MKSFHNPVLLNESIEGLNINENGIYVDATFGGGGHSLAIVNKIKSGKVIAFDQDIDAISRNEINDKRLTILNQNFKYLKNGLDSLGVKKIDGLIADLGISSYQLDTDHRGLSFNANSDLDMRMNQKSSVCAKQIINNYKAEELNKLFSEYADFKNPKNITSHILEGRIIKEIKTVKEFTEILSKTLRGPKKNQLLARAYQAIRIEVNKEIECLKELLLCGLKLLKPKGRIVVISYHSVEDKIVKNFFRYGGFNSFPQSGIYKNEPSPFSVITKKPIKACIKEIEINNRARSARLRIAQLK